MWQYNNLPDADELYHHGILGMKWGVRRSKKQLDRLAGRTGLKKKQTDGVVGGKRSKNGGDIDEVNTSDGYKRAHSTDISTLSDKELNDVITRLRNEKAYAELNPAPVSRGQKFMDYMKKKAASLGDKAVDGAIDVGVQVGKAKLKQVLEEQLGLRDAEYEALKLENNKMSFRKKIAEDKSKLSGSSSKPPAEASVKSKSKQDAGSSSKPDTEPKQSRAERKAEKAARKEAKIADNEAKAAEKAARDAERAADREARSAQQEADRVTAQNARDMKRNGANIRKSYSDHDMNVSVTSTKDTSSRGVSALSSLGFDKPSNPWGSVPSKTDTYSTYDNDFAYGVGNEKNSKR
jgi:hypothetical protein